jgi:hypothetical protein
MPFGRRKSKAVPFNAADVANIAKSNPYIQRLIEDDSLRDNMRTAVDSSKEIYDRLSDGKTSAKALLEDKKVQSELRKVVESVRDVTIALTDAPKAKARKKGRRFGRLILVAGVGGGAAMVGSEKLRSKVLDVLFGAEEEFEYTPPAPPPPTATPPTTQAAA